MVMRNGFYTTTTSVDESGGGALTLEAFRAAEALLPPVLWYAASPYIESGKYYILPATDITPETHVVSADDELEFLSAVQGRHIARHIREYTAMPPLGLDLAALDALLVEDLRRLNSNEESRGPDTTGADVDPDDVAGAYGCGEPGQGAVDQ